MKLDNTINYVKYFNNKNKIFKLRNKIKNVNNQSGGSDDEQEPQLNPSDYPNKIKENDKGDNYISRKNKKGICKWVKIVKGNSPNEFFKQFPDYKKEKYNTSYFYKNIK